MLGSHYLQNCCALSMKNQRLIQFQNETFIHRKHQFDHQKSAEQNNKQKSTQSREKRVIILKTLRRQESSHCPAMSPVAVSLNSVSFHTNCH